MRILKTTRKKSGKPRGNHDQTKMSTQSHLLQNVMEALAHPFCLINAKDYTILMANEAAHSGSLPDGATCFSLIHNRTKRCPYRTCPVNRALKTMSHVVMEHIHHDQDGNAKHVEVHAHPIIEADGKVRQVAVYSVDVTMHVQVEEALRKSEDRYRSFLRNFRGIAYHGDMEWTPIFFHGAVEEITGYTEDDFITKKVTLDGVIHPDDWHHVLECDRKLHAISGYSEERFYRIIRKDGEIRWIRDIIENIRNGSGSYSLVQGVMYDITEQKRVEKEREQQRRELELYGSLLRHDLGNDLQIVIGYAEAIQVLSAGVDDEKAKMLGHVIAGAERMKQVLIAFGRLRPWRGNNIFTLMKQIAIQAEDVHEGLIVRVSAEKGAKKLLVTGGELLPMVFENLIRNIADHAGPRAIAEIVVSKEDVYAQVIVSDNGPGIPAKIRRNLFQKGTSTRGGGLGLYLTRQILKTYEGSIDLVESKDGKGAVFRIRLPLAT